MNLVYFVIAVVFVIMLVSLVYSRRHQRRLAKLRGLSESEFIQHFSERDVPAALSQMVYRVFREKARSPNFSPSPEMNFGEVFNEEPEDVYDDARYILNKMNISEVPEDVQASWSGGEVKTLEDLTMWLSWVYARRVG